MLCVVTHQPVLCVVTHQQHSVVCCYTPAVQCCVLLQTSSTVLCVVTHQQHSVVTHQRHSVVCVTQLHSVVCCYISATMLCCYTLATQSCVVIHQQAVLCVVTHCNSVTHHHHNGLCHVKIQIPTDLEVRELLVEVNSCVSDCVFCYRSTQSWVLG